jgi:hypothetical protein
MRGTNRTQRWMPVASLAAIGMLASNGGAQELGETLRTIVGFEQAGASSAPSSQRFFGNFYASIPFPGISLKKAGTAPKGFDFGPRVRVFSDVRITTVPQQIKSGIGEFTAQFAQQVAEVKVNEVAQATEFLAGTEIRLHGIEKALSSFDGETLQRFTINLLFQGGATTPLTPREILDVFDIRAGTLNSIERARLEARFPQTKGSDYVAFTTLDRDRFFRQYYGGFRFKTYYFDKDDKRLGRFPSTLDVSFGGNEAVTGGRFHGGVLRIDFFQSIPVGGWAGSVFFYGTFLLKPARTNIVDPLLLRPASGVTVPADNVAVVFSPQINRDYYRIGFGVELISLFRQLRSPAGVRVN